MQSRIRYGMVGGGPDSLFGKIHRLAAAAENDYELVCGAFSRDKNKSLQLNQQLNLDPKRIYASYQEMLMTEAQKTKDERMQVVSIVTPNNTHFEIAKLALQHGFHIVLEKPITMNLIEAKLLQDLIATTGLSCFVCYTNTGFPMIKQAREMVANGDIGEIRLINVAYYQGWLSSFVEGDDLKPAVWRTDPSQSGIAGTIADIGTHAFNLAEYISKLKVVAVDADVHHLVPQRKIDDYGTALLKFQNGIAGSLSVCQAATGESGNLKIDLYGDKGHLQWELLNPHQLILGRNNQPTQLLRAGDDNAFLSQAALNNGRVPGGKGESSIDALANHYHNFARAIKMEKAKHHDVAMIAGADFPTIAEGVRGMAFIDAVIASNQSEKKWLPLGEQINYTLFNELTIENCEAFLTKLSAMIKNYSKPDEIRQVIADSLFYKLKTMDKEIASSILAIVNGHELFNKTTLKFYLQPNNNLPLFSSAAVAEGIGNNSASISNLRLNKK